MKTPELTQISIGSPQWDPALHALALRGETDLEKVEDIVRAIVKDVRKGGDRAVRDYVQKFEKREVKDLLVRDYGGKEALASLSPQLRDALTTAAARIRRYHEEQAKQLISFEYEEEGVTLGGRVSAVERAGLYAPGGKASYPSTVLMCAVPAQVAGVKEIYLACPDSNAEVRAACYLSGVTALVDAGGAQAIAAMAYGTESIPRVDKIVGPGNIFVAAAKRLVFGQVDIDSIAGPSEILVLADESADPNVVAADLLSQAEHDEDAYPLLVTVGENTAAQAQQALKDQLALLPEFDSQGRKRRSVAEESVRRNGMTLVVETVDELVDVANTLAAEHVSIQMNDARAIANRIKWAGALFIGHNTPEAAGDYLAGPSHVLPTGGAARFASPLGVYDFVARTSMISYKKSALKDQAQAIVDLARAEGLEAHARAVEARFK